MDKQRLLHIIESPEQISKEDVQQLKAISTAFPTSSIIQMLCLKGLKQHDEFQFHRNLKQRSGQVLNRKELKKLIYPETTEQPEITFTSIPTVKIDNKPVELPKEVKPAKEDVPVLEIVQDSKAEKKRLKKLKKEQKKKKGKTQHIYPTLTLSTENRSKPEEPTKEPLAPAETSPITEVEPIKPIDSVIEIPKQLVKEEKPKNTNSFAAWLTEHSNVDTSHLLTKINADEEEITFEKTPEPLEKPSAEKSVSELIDSFIETSPKVQRPKSEFFSPVNMGKKSMEDNEEFVTETLAELMASAGNAPKAIRYFEILSLNYPEKRDYFAGRISELKQGKK